MTSPSKQEALAETFAAFRQENDARLAALEGRGGPDPLVDDKLQRIEQRLDALSLKAATPDLSWSAEGAPSAGAAPDTAWQAYLRAGDEAGVQRLNTKALSSVTEAEGGYVAPPELDRLIESRLLQASPMRQMASLRQTSTGLYCKPVSQGVGAHWVGETDPRIETDVAPLSLLDFPAGELFAMPAATQALLDDAWVDLDAWLADEVEGAFAAQESTAFLLGDGVHKPRGLLDYPRAPEGVAGWGEVATLPGDFSQPAPADQLIELIHALKTPYRAGARFLMNRRTAAAVRRLKDADGRYLWTPGEAGAAARLLGYELTELEDMPDVAPGAPAIAFGNIRRAYLILDRQGARVLRDPYTAKPYVLFYTTKRVGGGIQNFDAVKCLEFVG